MIPLYLLERTIGLLEEIEPSVYSESRFEYFDILWALQIKIQKLNLRKAYEKIIEAGEHGPEHDFCVKCLRLDNHPYHMDEGCGDDDEIPF
jgi:hypothetical protein